MGAGESRSISKNIDVNEIAETCELPVKTVHRLWKRFCELDKDNKGKLDADDFDEIHAFHLNPLSERIIALFLDSTGHCDFESFCKLIAVFQPCDKNTPPDAINSPRKKATLLYQLFDLGETYEIDHTHVFDILLLMVGKDVDVKQLKQISKRVILETTEGDKHKVSLEEFLNSLDEAVVGLKMSVGY